MQPILSTDSEITEMPLFAMLQKQCKRCFDTGIWLTPSNEVWVCPRIQCGDLHAEPNDASLILRRSVNRLFAMHTRIDPMCFDLARILSNFSSETPCSRQAIFDHFFGDTNFTYQNCLRKFHGMIEELRRVWLMPIGSRKKDPSGYWIITDLEDFKAWVNRVKSAPITQLTTIHKVAKHNFPIFAEQLELEFYTDIQEVENE